MTSMYTVPFILGELPDNTASVGFKKNYPGDLVHFIFLLGIKLFCLSRYKAEIFSICLILDFKKPYKISDHLDNIQRTFFLWGIKVA
jgi:hypothetical protein